MPKKRSKKEHTGLNAVKFGLALGILGALCVFLTTALGSIGLFENYVDLSAKWLYSVYGFIGYRLSFVGAILGAIYSFIDCFIIGWVFATIYNKLL